MSRDITVSIVYARPTEQWLKELQMQRGSSVADLLDKANVLAEIPALSGMKVEQLQLGIYAQKVTLEHLLEDGERIEIYRPLRADPKEVRRQLALLGTTIGKKASADEA